MNDDELRAQLGVTIVGPVIFPLGEPLFLPATYAVVCVPCGRKYESTNAFMDRMHLAKTCQNHRRKRHRGSRRPNWEIVPVITEDTP